MSVVSRSDPSVVLAVVVAMVGAAVIAGAGIGVSVADGGAAVGGTADAGADVSMSAGEAESTTAAAASLPAATTTPPDNVSEEPFVEPAPEPGDPYFEAAASDGSWVSYVNPRDEYRSPYLGDGSGKLCVTLVNEDGDVVAGESVPNTSVAIPTGESLTWHSQADPFTVEFPVTDYDRPLDSDQFGTDPDVAQGDGYLDSHCFEWHGLPEDETVDYGEAEIEGEYADRIELVGYIQQEHDSWDTDVDPIADAEPYEDAGGWTYHPDGSHGQAVVVLQLDGPGDATVGGADGDDGAGSTDGDDADGEQGQSPADDAGDGAGDDGDHGSADDTDDGLPGFGAVTALVAIVSLLALASGRVFGRSRR